MMKSLYKALTKIAKLWVILDRNVNVLNDFSSKFVIRTKQYKVVVARKILIARLAPAPKVNVTDQERFY